MANMEKIETRIERVQAKLDALLLRKEELNKQIADTQKILDGLKAERKVKKLGTLDAIAESKGLSVDELLTAIQNGDLYALQEKLESAQSADAENDAETAIAESEVESREEGTET